ncbi:MAG: 50S ribosomal protein L35 [Candidatus Zambryskibacteria bacterium]|nr:50S ribosomal protein L35 [Candidatus Zambryskibacteria bacterium]
MAMKTNKSFSKRLKLTKSGKLLNRKSGRNHFNAKDRRPSKSAKNKLREFHITNKSGSRFLVNIKS